MQRLTLYRDSSRVLIAFVLLCLAVPTAALHAQSGSAGQAAFTLYATAVEHRLTRQHATTFLSPLSTTDLTRLRSGELLITPVTEPTATPPGTPNATLSHWRGTAFLPRAHAADFDHLLRNLPAYPHLFAPEVLRAALLTADPLPDTGASFNRDAALTPASPPLLHTDHLTTAIRLREHHVLTVTLDTTYDLTLTRDTPTRGYSTARSLRIAEIADPGTPQEHPLAPADAHGFLLRLNTYWTWQERPEGLYLQIETVSLSRAVPAALAWALHPYIRSIPRDSLTFTLTAVQAALTH